MVPLRQLDRGFYGIECPHLGVEFLIAQLTKLLVHYGCQPGIGIQTQVTMELLITGLGILAQPLQVGVATIKKILIKYG